jgi:uncharacterized membrane protein
MGTQPRTLSFTTLAAVTAAAMLQHGHWILQAVAVLGTVLLPGAALSHALGTDQGTRPANTVVAAGYGVTLMMLIGWLTSMVMPRSAYRPGTQITIYVIVLALAAILEQVRRGNILGGILPRDSREQLALAAACVLPALTLLAVERLDRGNGSGPALVAFLAGWALLLVTVIVACTRAGERHPGGVLLGLWSSGLSVIWGTASRGNHLFGWDIQKEYSVAMETIARGHWQAPADNDAYASMLSITSMPAQLEAIAGIAPRIALSICYPLLLSLLPVAAYSIVRRYTGVRAAAIATAGFVLAARSFPRQMPAIGRQEVALLLFAAGMVVATNTTISTRARRVGAVILLGATGFSHYTTAYVTLGLVVTAMLAARIVTRREKSERRELAFSPLVTAAVAVLILGWNLGIAPTKALLEDSGTGVQSEGLAVLPGQGNENQSLWSSWIEGSSAIRAGSPDDYARELSMLRETRLAWMDSDVYLGNVEPLRAVTPKVSGPFDVLNGAWQFGASITGQLMVLLLTAGTVALLTRRRWREAGIPTDLLGALAAAFVLNILLRLSGTASNFYNPERGALHNAVILVVPVALLIENLAQRHKRYLALLGALVMTFSVATWGVAPYLFGGSPPAASAEFGEDTERFLVTPAELATSHWLTEELGERDLVQGDRYAQVVLLNDDRTAVHGKVFILHPDFVDYGAYIFATRANTVEGRARGLENRVFSLFESPTEEFARLRATVYATDETRVMK